MKDALLPSEYFEFERGLCDDCRMKRRNFFALLFAPLVARIRPKPSSAPALVDLNTPILTEAEFAAFLDTMPIFSAYYTTERQIQILGPEGLTEADFDPWAE